MRGDELIELIPWYRGFRGNIIKENEKYISKGMYRLLDDSEIEIYELPIGKWTDDYKEFLDSLIIEKGERKKIEPGCRNCHHGAEKHGADYVPKEWDVNTQQWLKHDHLSEKRKYNVRANNADTNLKPSSK